MENAVMSIRRSLTRNGAGGLRLAEDQKEPLVDPPYPAGRRSVESTPEAPARGGATVGASRECSEPSIFTAL